MCLSQKCQGFIFLFLLSTTVSLGQNKPSDQKNVHPDLRFAEATEMNSKANGFRGIWYMNQPSNDEYVYKYSGGLGTYTTSHQPLAIYSEVAQKTFFCFGGTDVENSTLLHNISYFDHQTGKVANPTIVIDKNTIDAHDNPVISLDDKGYIWMFSTSHGTTRPSYIYKSVDPFSIDKFSKINATEIVDNIEQPLDNFSYFQVWFIKSKGFFAVYTKYKGGKGWNNRIIGFNTSSDGIKWNEWKVLAHIDEGHYAVSGEHNGKIGIAFNYHPAMGGGGEVGLNYRTNLYYIETDDFGENWHSVEGEKLTIPLLNSDNQAMAKNLQAEGRLCYLQDLNFDKKGNPVVLVTTSNGYQSGPANNPRIWEVFAYRKKWINSKVTTSDNNYDTGSIFCDMEGKWLVIGPTEQGPQQYNPGGEMAAWESRNLRSRKKKKQLTANSSRNHNFFRRSLNTHPDFLGIWADGHGRQPSVSYLYFTNRAGEVFRLPVETSESHIIPIPYTGEDEN